MTREEAKLILGVYRPDKEDAGDAFFAEALKLATEDAELAKWFAAEQAFDAQIASRLRHGEAPEGLKEALLAALDLPAKPRWTFARALSLAGATAAIAVLLTLAFTRSRDAAPAGQLADFRAEMMSFMLPSPPLPFETSDVEKMREWVQQTGAAHEVRVPKKTQQLPPVGCRTLIFRGHKVGLLCFKRADGKLVHLLVINRAAFDGATLPTERLYHQEGEWMTAAWTEHDQVYLLAAQGDREQLHQFL
ncbi:MAG: hypothetical protein LC642_07270 [Verrucomicrobiaceae bacterium]|nr:hypothetical protein [Verrucomicrobiaceae bacterium]